MRNIFIQLVDDFKFFFLSIVFWILKIVLKCFLLVTGKILLIALPVAGFVLLVTIGCCIYCCCCRKTRARGG